MRQVQIEILFQNGEIREIRQDYKKMNLLDFSAIQGKPIEKWFSSAESDYEEWHGLEKAVAVDDPNASYAYEFHGPEKEKLEFNQCVETQIKGRVGLWLSEEQVAQKYISTAELAWKDGEVSEALWGYQIAAEEYHSVPAMKWIAEYHYRGYRDNKQKNQPDAEKWLDIALQYWRMAAENQDTEIQFQLGMRFQKGEDVAVDLTEAAKWYGMAAENENAEAQFYMANAYSAGTGVKQDNEKAANWYRQAAEQGHGQAQLDYADCCFEGKGRPADKNEAVIWYQKAAEKGLEKAQLALANCLWNGVGIACTPASAAHWYQKAAQQGNAEAQNKFGDCLTKGIGVPQNTEEAEKYYNLSAQQGNTEAEYHYAACRFQKGDYAQAWLYYQRSADKGYTLAQYELGLGYEKGTFGEEKAELAFQSMRKAALDGYAPAQLKLGESGVGGSTVSLGQMLQNWFQFWNRAK